MAPQIQPGQLKVLTRQNLQTLLDALHSQDYEVVGPTVRHDAIVYDTLRQTTDFPEGWTDEQEGGTYRLKKRSDNALFGYVVGPQSWKQYLFPPRQKLWEARKDGKSFQIVAENTKPPKYAFFGVRSCELSAIFIQDKVFLDSGYTDPVYSVRRENVFLVAVQCGQAGNTCFCASMNTGPKADQGFDLALTELIDDKRHEFLVEIGSPRGAELLQQIPVEDADAGRIDLADQATARAQQQMGRQMQTEGIKDLLQNNINHSRWQEVAEKCLTCANCTMVCPTCFCSTVEDVTDISGDHAERWRRWDSCFNLDFTEIHGGHARHSTQSRYRQWMTHKLSTWHDQFDSSGCVGCGRCITWCPVGIDITEETAAIRNSPDNKEKN